MTIKSSFHLTLVLLATGLNITPVPAAPSGWSDQIIIVADGKNLNPTNDPDVQSGINQRMAEEKQKRIDACVLELEANLTVVQRLQQHAQFVQHCTPRESAVGAVRD